MKSLLDGSPVFSLSHLKSNLVEFWNSLKAYLYPALFEMQDMSQGERLDCSMAFLCTCLGFVQKGEDVCNKTVSKFFSCIDDIKAIIETDIIAAYEGDPAAESREEIILSYPAFEAIGIYRIAHQLFMLGIPLLPRMLSEYAHAQTGIDIHPGAIIGSHFFIDHGTGVVIGETTVIGSHVKIYQGVTLGAKSFEFTKEGEMIRGRKRHPNIGDNVIIYSGATILGGDTSIGDGCIIGGNVWLTHSVEPNKTVIAAMPETLSRSNK